jgi:hypothetical protein
MNYFPKGNFMNSIYSAVNRVQGRGEPGSGARSTGVRCTISLWTVGSRIYGRDFIT